MKNKEEDKVIVRSNGTATYIAKDIPYAAWKLGLVDDPFTIIKNMKKSNQMAHAFYGKPLWMLQITFPVSKLYWPEKVITVIDSRQARLQKIITIA